MVGLLWMMLEHFLPPIVPRIVPFWVTYGFLVYQLVSFHDYNACFLKECSTNAVFSYITLVCTLVFWFTMSTRLKKVEPKEPKEPKEPEKPVPTEPLIFPALKIRVQPRSTKNGSLRLNMGESIQPKWV